MMTRKPLIAIIFASFAILSGVSCISRVSLPLGINSNNQTYILLSEDSGCKVQFTPFLSYCSNNVFQSFTEANTCRANILGRSPFYEYGVDTNLISYWMTLIFKLVLITLFSIVIMLLLPVNFALVKEQENNDNIIDQPFQQGLISEKKFYIDVQNLYSNTKAGSIDIGNPNYNWIKQGYQFITLKPYTLNSGYYAVSNRKFNYGQTILQGGNSVNFNIYNAFIQIPESTLNSIIKEMSKQAELTYIPEEDHFLFINQPYGLFDISFDLIADNGSNFTIKLTPYDYTRVLSNEKYQVLLYPSFYSNNISLGYTILKAYYVAIDFTSQKIMIVKKNKNKISPQ